METSFIAKTFVFPSLISIIFFFRYSFNSSMANSGFFFCIFSTSIIHFFSVFRRQKIKMQSNQKYVDMWLCSIGDKNLIISVTTCIYIQPYSSDEKYPELSAAHCHRIEIEISIVIISCCWFSLVSSFGKLDILFTKSKRTNLKLLKACGFAPIQHYPLQLILLLLLFSCLKAKWKNNRDDCRHSHWRNRYGNHQFKLKNNLKMIFFFQISWVVKYNFAWLFQ